MIALRVLKAGDDPFRPIVPAVVTSFVGFGVGSAIGYVLAVLLPAPIEERAPLSYFGAPDLALATLAWGDRGPVPDAADLLTEPGPAGVVGGGDGFGALWIRPEGRPLAVTARVGSPGMAAALSAVAQATDARAVLLCGVHGPACDGARAQLARRLPLLRLEDGDRTVLQVAGRIPEALRTSDLSASVGPVAIEPGTGDAVLFLAPDARAKAAATSNLQDAPPLDANRLSRPLSPADTSDAVALRVMDEEVIGLWLAWWRREPYADDALRAAAGMAGALGLELTATADRSALAGPGFRVILDRTGTPGIVDVRESAPGHRTVGVARSLSAALGAAAVVEGALPGIVRLGATDAEAPAHAALVGLLEGLGPGVRVTTVRTSQDGRDPGADLVLSLGRPAFDPSDVGAVLPALADRLGLAWSPFDGDYSRAWCQDPGDLSRFVARAANGVDSHLTVYAGPDTRSRLGGDADDVPLAFAIRSGALATETTDLWAKIDGATLPSPSWDQARDLAHRAVATGALADLKALRRAGEVHALRDPVLGTRWLGVRRCEPPDVCAELAVPLGGPCDGCGDLSGDVRSAFALGSADLSWEAP
jgi:hypothetical protein